MGDSLKGHEDFYQRVCQAYDKLPEAVKDWLDQHNYVIHVDLTIPPQGGDTWGCHFVQPGSGAATDPGQVPQDGSPYHDIFMGYQYGSSASPTITESQIDLYSGMAHEIGHALDAAYNFSGNSDFQQAYNNDCTNKSNFQGLNKYVSGSDAGVNDYSDTRPASDHPAPDTKGQEEVAADLLAALLGANGQRANDVSNSFQQVSTFLNGQSSATQFSGPLQSPNPGKF